MKTTIFLVLLYTKFIYIRLDVRKNASIVNYIAVRISVFYFLLSLVGFYIISQSTVNDFRYEADSLKTNIINDNKKLIKNEIDKALEYIDIETSKLNKSLKSQIKTETNRLTTYIETAYEYLAKSNSKKSVEAEIVKMLNSKKESQILSNTMIMSLNGKLIYDFSKKLQNGIFLLNETDVKNTFVTKEEIKLAKTQKEGFISSFWQGKFNDREKVTYIKNLEPLPWYIKTEIFSDEFIKANEKDMYKYISSLKFGEFKSGYFFIDSLKGDIIISDGKYYNPPLKFEEIADKNKQEVMQSTIDMLFANPNGAFKEYIWSNKDKENLNRLSFMVKIPNKEEFIGAGITMKNIEKILAAKEKQLDENIKEKLFYIGLLFAASMAMLFIFLLVFAIKMKSNIKIFFDFLNSATEKYNEMPVEQITFNEFKDIGMGINLLTLTLKEKEQEIINSASHDYLTGLPNKMMLKENIDKYIQEVKLDRLKIGIIFIDLDMFKKINDSLGHQIGDLLLQEIANRLKSVITNKDKLLRIGGDEFVILLSQIPFKPDIENFANTLLLTLSKETIIKNHVIKPSGSIGISVYPDDGRNSNTLIRCADVAMYEAKQKGRNNFQFFDKEMDDRIFQTIKLEKEIQDAINKNEFILYYQPKVSLETNKIVGAEALIRWNHPTKGLVFPDYFINIAERSNLINKLGAWILKQGCRQQALWEKQGFRLKIAINLSVKQLQNINCLNEIKEAIEASSANPNFIELEITESFSANDESNIKTLHELKNLGFSLAIDDFGTGYSSLSYLSQLPIDTIKIDRSFITGMLDDYDKKALVEVIIQTAKILRKQTVAEGVETKEDMQALAELGCNEYQGYYFSKAIASHEFGKLLTKLI